MFYNLPFAIGPRFYSVHISFFFQTDNNAIKYTLFVLMIYLGNVIDW